MVEATTIVRALLGTATVLPGVFMTLIVSFLNNTIVLSNNVFCATIPIPSFEEVIVIYVNGII